MLVAAADAARFTKPGLTMETTTASQKKQYDPPQVTAIKLRPEEAVLGFCKSMSSAGQFSSCHQPGGNCHGIGS
jgi:hypothetical protein